MFNKRSNIYIAGHTGLLGSAIFNVLMREGYETILTSPRSELDLTCKDEVERFFFKHHPEYVFICAGKVGGIIGNKTYPASYLHENLLIQDNLFEAANRYGVKHVLFYGSSCTYPKLSPQPIKEEYWLSGQIEETSMGYAAAKIAGIIGCKAYNSEYQTNRFICVIPNSIYGPNDNFDVENSHVFSALIRKIDTAKKEDSLSVNLWGSGNPRREFIFSEDVAYASLFLMENADKLENTHYNLGTSEDLSIKELAKAIAKMVGYQGEIVWDSSKPDGAPQKLLDSTKFLALGWKPKTSFEEGLKITYEWYRKFYE
jgi:GDP-L-fucose synthase